MTRGTLASPCSGQLGSNWHVLEVNTALRVSENVKVCLGRLLRPTSVVQASNSASGLDQIVTYVKTLHSSSVSPPLRGEEGSGISYAYLCSINS
jgi:hypothetical protein